MSNWEYLRSRVESLANIECIWARRELNLEEKALEFRCLNLDTVSCYGWPLLIELAAIAQDKEGRYWVTEIDGAQMQWDRKYFKIIGELYRGGHHEVSIADLNNNILEFEPRS